MSKQYLDKSVNKYFTYDADTDEFIYTDGSRRRRPGNIDRSTFATAATPRSERRDVAAETSRAATLRSDAAYSSTPNPREPSYTYGTANAAVSPTVRPSALAQQARSPEEPAQSLMRDMGASMASLNIGALRSDGYNSSSSGQIQRPAMGTYQSQEVRPQPGYATPSQYQAQPTSRRPSEAQRAYNPPQSAQAQARELARRQQFQPTQSQQGNLQVRETYNPINDVRTRVATREQNSVQRITDPGLFQDGVAAQSLLLGTGSEGEPERLYSTFRVRPHSFFVVGRVFLVLWVEPAGATTVVTGLEQNDGVIPGRYHDEFIFSKVRRFVIIRQSGTYCSALPIVSYGNRGVGKKGVNKAEHAIIYTGNEPAPLPSEAPGRDEPGMRRTAIRVVPDNPTDKLDPVSRIDFGKVHTVQHNIKVKPFGMVHKASENALLVQFRNAWHGEAVASALASRSAAQDQMSNPERQSANPYGYFSTYAGPQNGSVPASTRRESTYGTGSVASRTSGMATYGSTTTGSRTVAQTPSSSQGYPPSLSNESVRSADARRRMQSVGGEDSDEDTGQETEQRQRRSEPGRSGSSQRTQSVAQRPPAQSAQSVYPGQAPIPQPQPSAQSISSQQRFPSGYSQPTQPSSSNDPALSRSAPTRGSTYAPAGPQSGTSAAKAEEARFAQDAYRRLTNEGRTPQQAFQALVKRYLANHPEVSIEQAESAIRGRLNYPTG